MALSNQGVKVSLSTTLLPSGFTAPAVTTFIDQEYCRTMTLTVSKAAVENVTKATTLTNILTQAVDGVSAQVDAIMSADYDATLNTITYYIDAKRLSNNVQPSPDTDFYNTTAVSYVVVCDVYIKTAVI